jgi:phage terminase large subunit-like protein
MPRLPDFRKGKRYWFNAPVRFTWLAPNGEERTSQGITRDVNTAGAYIVADELPPVGALVQLEIALPKMAKSPSGMCLHGEGIVLRTEFDGYKSAGAGRGGFAAAMQFYPEWTDAVVSQLKSSVLVM